MYIYIYYIDIYISTPVNDVAPLHLERLPPESVCINVRILLNNSLDVSMYVYHSSVCMHTIRLEPSMYVYPSSVCIPACVL